MKITLAQLNPIIGDFRGNIQKMRKAADKAQEEGSDLIIFSELFASGYPPKDWLIKQGFISDFLQSTEDIIELSGEFPETGFLFGAIDVPAGKTGKGLFNAAFLVQNGKCLFVQHKTLLPTYDVFDEARYFDTANNIAIFEFKNSKLGITICEDIWNESVTFPNPLYKRDPVDILAKKGAEIIINISASPFSMNKDELRYEILKNHARKHGLPIILVNQTGANDELISDGRSMVVDSDGELRCILAAFEEQVKTVDLSNLPAPQTYKAPDPVESAYQGLVLGIHDYANKCGFTKAIFGLSGGVDSALTCCLAAAALGPANVYAVYMPSPYSADSSEEDARELADNLGVNFQIIPITSLFSKYKETLQTAFINTTEDVAEENIQARIRGNIIMALSNKFGYLPLASGNKSELSVGYCTLYGDMSGGLSVLADVYKTLVYELCKHINRGQGVIPARILSKAPSAELKPDQKDSDSLPPYDILDEILNLYIEQQKSTEEIIKRGFNAETVSWIIKTVKQNEYKRLQAAPGLKICSKAFGCGRRIPIAAKWDQNQSRPGTD